jgi:hypothetical protein
MGARDLIYKSGLQRVEAHGTSRPAASYNGMLHSAAELRDRARECRERASHEADVDRQAALLELANTFDEAGTKVEQDGTFEDGYEEGWSRSREPTLNPRTRLSLSPV